MDFLGYQALSPQLQQLFNSFLLRGTTNLLLLMFPHCTGGRILPVHSKVEILGKARKLQQQLTKAMKDIAKVLF